MFRINTATKLSITKLAILLVIISLISLSGCATSNIILLPQYAGDIVPDEQGIVVATVVNAGGIALPYNQLTIVPKNLMDGDGGNYLRLQSLTSVPGTSSIYVSAVPIGEYSLSSLRAYYSTSDNSRWISRFREANTEFGTFTVAPNRITDLGTIIYYPKSEGEQYKETLIRLLPDSDKLASHITEYSPSIKKYTGENISWTEDDQDSMNHSAYVSAAQNPVHFSRDYLGPSGTLYQLAKLGVILKRNPDKKWELDSIDTNFDLKDILETNNGGLIAGGNFGKIFYKHSAQSNWQDISIPEKFSIEHFLEYGDIIYIFAYTGQYAHIVKINKNNLAKWETVAYFKYDKGWMNSQGEVIAPPSRKAKSPHQRPSIISSIDIKEFNGKHHLFVRTRYGNQHNILLSSKTFSFEFEPKTGNIYASKGFEKKINHIVTAGAVKLGIKKPGFWSLTQSPLYFRYDHSANQWNNVSTRIHNCKARRGSDIKCIKDGKFVLRYTYFEFLSSPIFFNDQEAMAVVRETQVQGEKKQKEPFIIKTDDGGSSWSRTDLSLPNNWCLDTIAEISDRWLLSCNGGSGDIYESNDRGKTWQHVREHAQF